MPISEWELLLRLGVAIALGGAIGYERELRDRPAGLRTHLIVALAAATFTVVSLHVVYFQHYANDGVVRIDVGRIASNIVVGIGFLGGGAILHSGKSIKGLTTAASLWLTASVGLAAGGGMFVVAFAVTAASLFALSVLWYAIEQPRKRLVQLEIRLKMAGEFVSRAALAEFLGTVGPVRVTGVDYSRNLADNRSQLRVSVSLPDESLEEATVRRLESLEGVRRVVVKRSG